MSMFALFVLLAGSPTMPQSPAAELYQAAWTGQAAVVRSALARGADADLRLDEDGTSPLYMASLAGHEAVLDVLIEAGANVDIATSGGETPIIAASKYGFTRIAAKLIEAGADVNAADQHGRTAIVWASWGENAALERLLMASGSDGSSISDPFEDSVPIDRFEKDPQLTKTGKIKMPRALKDEAVTGTVTLRVIVDRKGKPLSVDLVEGIHDELDENILKAAKKWRFNPGEVQGKPVVSQLNAVIEFVPANQAGQIMTLTKRWRN